MEIQRQSCAQKRTQMSIVKNLSDRTYDQQGGLPVQMNKWERQLH